MRKYLVYTLLAALSAPVAVLADDDHDHGRHEGWREGRHEEWREEHREHEWREAHEWHHHHHLYRENYYMEFPAYAPVAVAPAPVIVAPPPSSLNIVVPLR